MDIQNKTVLVLGGWGLVGNAVTKKMMRQKPKRLIITSLKREEAEEEVTNLRKAYKGLPKNFFAPWWGNIFVREEFKDIDRFEVLNDPVKRNIQMRDTMDELDNEILHSSSLYQLITKYKPEIIIDCINSATGIAYQDIYQTYRNIQNTFDKKPSYEALASETEKLLCTMYIPQLIRHIQILYKAMAEAKTMVYVKIGTSGTGGMGLNIPYTHSEEKPSRVLLSKSAVAGAQTLLLFLMGRTPDSGIIKEIKPAAAIAWKKITFDEVKKRGRPIEIFDLPLTEAVQLQDTFNFKLGKKFNKAGYNLKSVFIDTGENGIFSRGEFEAITAQKQMEFVTPEEIAEDVIFEIKGGNTGHDIINALDNSSLQPSYRAGYMQHMAVAKLAELEKQNDVSSVAFEMLGPPRLSKLLYELHIISLICGTMKGIIKESPQKLSAKCFELISDNQKLRNEIISLGIPVLLPDGKTLLRGPDVKIPKFEGEESIKITDSRINLWSKEGWVDLRKTNMSQWQRRIKTLISEAEAIPETDTSSMHVRTRQYWNNYGEINLGKVVSWIFIHEEKGLRMKA
jgi:hypothetical protein